MHIQPSNFRGRATRMLLLPLVWGVAGFIVYVLICLLASYEKMSPRALLRTDSMWMLAFMLPAIFFGHTSGLIAVNILALAISPLRKTFNAECKSTGRHGFWRATRSLLIIDLAYGLLTLGGSCLFLSFK
jgi:hypothetical protein